MLARRFIPRFLLGHSFRCLIDFNPKALHNLRRGLSNEISKRAAIPMGRVRGSYPKTEMPGLINAVHGILWQGRNQGLQRSIEIVGVLGFQGDLDFIIEQIEHRIRSQHELGKFDE